jgi:hypothetical protein
LLQPIPLEAVNVALRRLLNLHLEAVFEVVKRAVKLREPQYTLEVVAVRERRAPRLRGDKGPPCE